MSFYRILLTLFISLGVHGQGVQPFDVAGTGSDSACVIVLPIDSPVLQFLGISTEDDTDIDFIAAGGSGRVLALVNPRSVIVEVRPDLTRTPVFAGIDGTFGLRFLVDAAGNIYIATNTGRLLAIRPDGTIRADYALNVFAMDLAADQCTLFYSTIGGIRRFDVCNGTALPDFLPGAAISDIKLLPDGGLLRLDDDDPEVVRYDPAGTPVRTYPLPDVGTILALGRAGQTMFAGGGCDGDPIGEYDLDSGALLRSFSFEFNVVESLVAYNGFTAALGPLASAHVAAVPSLSTVMLAVLGGLLALIAVRRVM